MGYIVLFVICFCIICNVDLMIYEEGVRDLLKVIEKELKKCKWGVVVCLEVGKEYIDERVLVLLYEVLEVKDEDVYIMDGLLDLICLFFLYKKLVFLYEYFVYLVFIL